MTFLQKQLARLKAAGEGNTVKMPAKAPSAPHVKRYTVYGILGGREYAVGFGLHVIEAEMVIASARRRLIKSGLIDEDGKRLFEITNFEMREAA